MLKIALISPPNPLQGAVAWLAGNGDWQSFQQAMVDVPVAAPVVVAAPLPGLGSTDKGLTVPTGYSGSDSVDFVSASHSGPTSALTSTSAVVGLGLTMEEQAAFLAEQGITTQQEVTVANSSVTATPVPALAGGRRLLRAPWRAPARRVHRRALERRRGRALRQDSLTSSLGWSSSGFGPALRFGTPVPRAPAPDVVPPTPEPTTQAPAASPPPPRSVNVMGGPLICGFCVSHSSSSVQVSL